jgi:hypothetical protein
MLDICRPNPLFFMPKRRGNGWTRRKRAAVPNETGQCPRPIDATPRVVLDLCDESDDEPAAITEPTESPATITEPTEPPAAITEPVEPPDCAGAAGVAPAPAGDPTAAPFVFVSAEPPDHAVVAVDDLSRAFAGVQHPHPLGEEFRIVDMGRLHDEFAAALAENRVSWCEFILCINRKARQRITLTRAQLRAAVRARCTEVLQLIRRYFDLWDGADAILETQPGTTE